MENNKLLIIALLVIIIAILVGIFATMPNMNKQDTNLTFMCNSTINEGDSIVIKLTDANGNLLVNQTVNVTVTDDNKTGAYYSVVTNESGFGVLKLDKNAGEYNVTISYGGNDNYNGCSATQKLIIEKEEPTTSSSDSSSSSSRYIHDDGGTYDTVTGKYVGGQHDGQTKQQVEQYNHDIVEEERAYKREHGMI